MRSPRPLAVALALALLGLAAPVHAQTKDFEDQIVEGDYKGLAKKLREHADLSRMPADLAFHVKENIAFLERGAKPKVPGSEIILIRGAANDHVYHAQPSSGGDAFMLPNTIRYQHTGWDKRLDRINRYFEEATTKGGGDGKKQFDLAKIIADHAIASQKSVLISTGTRPISMFGPPFYIIKIAPERVIFNYNGLSGEYEVLIPFWVLPHEIVGTAKTYQEAIDNPYYKASKLRELEMSSSGQWGSDKDVWRKIDENIRAGKADILDGVKKPAPAAPVAPHLNSKFDEGRDVGPDATADEVARFVSKVEKHGGVVERVKDGDPRLPGDVQGRTTLGADGRPLVFLPEGTVKKFALIDELTHVLQLEREREVAGVDGLRKLFADAASGAREALDKLRGFEVQGKKMILTFLGQDDPARPAVERSLRALEVGDAARLAALREAAGIAAPKPLGERAGFLDRLRVEDRAREATRR